MISDKANKSVERAPKFLSGAQDTPAGGPPGLTNAAPPEVTGDLTTTPMQTTASNFPDFAMDLATTGSSKLPGTQQTCAGNAKPQCKGSL
jgi:hypothetical protein